MQSQSHSNNADVTLTGTRRATAQHQRPPIRADSAQWTTPLTSVLSTHSAEMEMSSRTCCAGPVPCHTQVHTHMHMHTQPRPHTTCTPNKHPHTSRLAHQSTSALCRSISQTVEPHGCRSAPGACMAQHRTRRQAQHTHPSADPTHTSPTHHQTLTSIRMVPAM